MALLSIENLEIAFGSTPAVRELSLEIAPGESLGLVGESGSGKSVTALAVLGLLDPIARLHGVIRFDGQNLLDLAPDPMRRLRGREIAMIFQEPMTALNPVMTVGEQIAESVRVHHHELSRRQVRETVLEAMNSVALPDPVARYGDYPHQFSGGQRQRILIAMAIVNQPRLLIADEPTTALDVTVQAQILELLADLRERFGLAMLFISHDLAVVSQVTDRVAVMRHGLLLEVASRESLFHNPLHPYTRSLLGAVPTMQTEINKPLATLSRSAEDSSIPLRECEPRHWARIGS
ncbi:ABC transporter ATP-binding protein [Paracidobacterium acidisoli]|uniref:ABC transporter ATP-binding protein n=1 Tax=Paracidobacterium acidisoli TaxID=2303751 RepID=A0A372IJE1_9BACT|nr:ABC transporter ATP-binding protein [Paracidobacterium acidisoli]